MTPAEAYHVLQLEPGAPRERIEENYAEQTRDFKEKRAKAPSPGHKAHFQQGLARLTAARDVLIQREDAAAGAARRQRRASQGAQEGPAEAAAKAVTAADVDAAIDRWPRRLNRHADGASRALLAALAGGLAGIVPLLVSTENAEHGALLVGGGLLLGLGPGIVWWRATVRRMRRDEWIKVREALEHGETLPLAWRRRALRLAVALLLLLGFAGGYRRWKPLVVAVAPEEKEPRSIQIEGVRATILPEPDVLAPSSGESLTSQQPDLRIGETPAKAQSALAESSAVRDRDQNRAEPASVPPVVAPALDKNPVGSPESPTSPTPLQPDKPAAAAEPTRSGDARAIGADGARAAGSTPPQAPATSAHLPAAEPLAPANIEDFSDQRPSTAGSDGAGAGKGNPTSAPPVRPGAMSGAARAAIVPAAIVRAEAAREAGGDEREIQAALAQAYHAWAGDLRETRLPGLALYALHRAEAAGRADEELAAMLRKEFTEANALTVGRARPQIRAAEGDGAEEIRARSAEWDDVLHADLAAALPALVMLKEAGAETKPETETGAADPREPLLVLRVQSDEERTEPENNDDAPRITASGETTALPQPLKRTLSASVSLIASRDGGEEEFLLLSVTATVGPDFSARATPRTDEADVVAALNADLGKRLRARRPELRAAFARATLAVMQARRAASLGIREEVPGDLEWGWFSVWVEAGLPLPQHDAELAARRALALPEAQPVGERVGGLGGAGVADHQD